MDLLNDYYPLYPNHPEQGCSDTSSEDNEHLGLFDENNRNRKRKKILSSDDFNMKYADDIWYIWCIIQDYSDGGLFDRLDYATFCSMCYEHSTKY